MILKTEESLLPYLSLAAPYYFFNVPAMSRPNGSYSRTRTRSGPRKVVQQKFTLKDRHRSTPACHGRPELPHRELWGEIWRPASPGKHAPLVVYSHGFMSNRRECLYLMRFLASHGYIVVAVDYPLTGRRSPGKPVPSDIVNQPGDISAVIDYMLRRNSDSVDELFNAINVQKIALAGLSFGALTSLLTTYHRELQDPRISAVISVAGPTTMLSEDFFAGNENPALMIYGDADSLVHYADHAQPAVERMADATLVTLRSGSHAGFAQTASTMLRLLKNPDSLPCRILRWNMDDKPWDFVSDLGGEEMGIVQPHEEIAPLTEPLIPVAMKASRQQMFTALAVHAFLEDRFADNPADRHDAHTFLHRTLPLENSAEVAVLR